MVPPSSGRISRVPPYSSTDIRFWIATGLSPALGGLSIPLRFPSTVCNPSGLLPVRSPLLRESRLISFPPGTEMFQFPGFASAGLCIHPEDTLARGFPHSDPPWSKALCASHGTFGAWPVLRRRRMPRHPPRAFLRLNPDSSDSALFCRMSSSNPPVFYWCFKSLCMLDCFMLVSMPKFQFSHVLAGTMFSAPGRCFLELRRLELLTSSLQSWRSTS